VGDIDDGPSRAFTQEAENTENNPKDPANDIVHDFDNFDS
jgi:hypothetical protein